MVASGSRAEQSVLHADAGGRIVVGIHPAHVIGRLARPPALDLAKLADFAALHDDAERTVYDGVRRLPFGTALHLSPGRAPRVERWWRPALEEDRSIRPEQAPGLVRDAVRDAVEASLPADGDVAATLSGGLDSSMVVGTAAALLGPQGRRVRALTHRPLPGADEPGGIWEADDGPYAAAMAATVPGIDLDEVVNLDGTTPLAADDWMIRRTWHPPFNPANQVWLNEVVRRAERTGSPVLLTGSSGNATFSREAAGIVRHLARSGRLGAVLRQVRARHGAGRPWAGAARDVAREAAPERLLAWTRARRGIAPGPGRPLGTADLPFRRELVSDAAIAQLALIEGHLPATRQRWVDFALNDESRIGAAQNLSETVWWSDPLSDPEVVALALRLPEESWIASGWDRGLARSAAEGLVPDRIRWRRTFGAQAADVGLWVAAAEPAYRALLEQLRASPSVPQFLDLDALEAGLHRGLTDPATAQLWQAVYGRAFSLGAFAVWYEDEVLAAAS
ncbi:asparagine synthase-related protein [Nocardioides sp. MH1]|uniref:asparagine synthase-related protein n=1 Tax=Nocardioides sp. MH1 TaxID=3242490 RepID=UPI003521F6B5